MMNVIEEHRCIVLTCLEYPQSRSPHPPKQPKHEISFCQQQRKFKNQKWVENVYEKILICKGNSILLICMQVKISLIIVAQWSSLQAKWCLTTFLGEITSTFVLKDSSKSFMKRKKDILCHLSFLWS